MKHLHTGLAASSEEKASLFFVDILELSKSESRIIDKRLVRTIFGINHELLMIHYKGTTVDYEIFVVEGFKAPEKQIGHSCLKVTDVKNIVNRCRNAGLKVVEVSKGTGIITFIADYDGNLFELKE